MTEKEKMQQGLLYDANYDEELLAARAKCKDLCFAYNQILPSQGERQQEILKQLLGKMGSHVCITAPFWCDYGYKITVGDHFYTNHNCVILDPAPVTFGHRVFVGPNCCFSTAAHPLDARRRGQGLEYAEPIRVGNDVWFGANVTVLPRVTIGDGAVIGAGSVVTRDIPPGVVAAGAPCRVLRPVTEADGAWTPGGEAE